MASEEHLQELTATLCKGGFGQRFSAILELQMLRDPRAESALFEALRDHSQMIRAQAARALVDLNSSRPAEPLLNELRTAINSQKSNTDPVEPEEIVSFGLTRLLSLPVVDILAGGLVSSDRAVRGLSLVGLGDTQNASAVRPLSGCLRDRESLIRREAVRALGRIPDRAAAEALLGVLDDRDRRIRKEAVRSLREMSSLAHEALENLQKTGAPREKRAAGQVLKWRRAH